jgi:hypothetical protein
MPVIPINQLRPGYVLELPVTNFLGNTLLKSGVKITEKNIVTLKTWGIKTVTIMGEDGEVTPGLDNDDLCQQKAGEELERLFSTVQDQPEMMTIYDIVKNQALKSRSPR